MTEKPLFQKIWHGESQNLIPQIPDGRVDCVITDPPFGVDNLSNMATTQAGKQYARKIMNDSSPEVALEVFEIVMDALMPKLAEALDVYVFTSYQVLVRWMVWCDSYFGDHGFQRKAVIRWQKDGPGMGDLECPWGMGSEDILFYRRGPVGKRGQRRPATVHTPQVRPDKLIHPHEKPLPLLEMFMQASTDERDFVVDPFGGSCSLARAARNINRSALCIEADRKNYELATQAYNQGIGGLF